jgi:hypothetical protein
MRGFDVESPFLKAILIVAVWARDWAVNFYLERAR